MSQLQILGAPQSTYVRVARIVAEEKGVAYELVPLRPHTPEIDAAHPFGRIPVLRHGDVTLCESKAIAGYLDRFFAGPSLIPADPLEQVRVEQWVSLVLTGFDPVLARTYLFAYIFPGTPDNKPDRLRIKEVLPEVDRLLAVLDRTVAATGHLVGQSFTLADAYILPILCYLKELPESGKLIARSAALRSYIERHGERPSVKATAPPPLPNFAATAA